MVGSLGETVVVGVLVVTAGLFAAVCACGFLLWRAVRRRWSAFRSHRLVAGGLALWAATSSARWREVRASTEDVENWRAPRVRRELRRHVAEATDAVRVASEAGAPTGSLPGLCRRLEETAARVDRVLRLGGDRPLSPEVAAQAGDVMKAATEVRQAAMAAADDANGHRVKDLVRETDQEVGFLHAGLATARSVLPPSP